MFRQSKTGLRSGVTWLLARDRSGQPDHASRTKLGVTWQPVRDARRLIPLTAMAVLVPLVPVVAPTVRDATAGSVSSYSASPADGVTFSGKSSTTDGMSLATIRDDGGLEHMAKDGHTGRGIDVALVDSGVTPVPGLEGKNKLVYGPDLSNESLSAGVAGLDGFGHGTHMAGIIAGNDGGQGEFKGLAPDSRIVSVKVAGRTGETDIKAIVAAIDWVVEHRNDNGLNIRVLNLSFGLDDVPSNINDPLSAAAERAWDAGIVVVAAAGNRGNGTDGLDAPAVSPFVIAVGAVTSAEDKAQIPEWTSAGNGRRDPDVVAPGQSVLGLRVPGSVIAEANPAAAVGDRYLKGTGTSQAAAVTSGSVAALLSAAPDLTPDQVKYLLIAKAKDQDKHGTKLDGAGLIRVKDSAKKVKEKDKAGKQNHRRATEGPTAKLVTPSGATWSGGTWSGGTWSGGTWSGATWSGATWSGATWSGGTWSGGTWSGGTWSGAAFNAADWG